MDAARASDDLQDLRRLLEEFPWFGSAWSMLGSRTQDPQEAEDALWRGLQLCPCRSAGYLALADFLTNRDESDAMAKQLRLLALWKFSFADKVPDFIAETFKTRFGAQASEPETYAIMAQAQEALSAEFPVDPVIDAKLRPYRLLNDLQRDSVEGLPPATLNEILQHREECEPVFRNALREWASLDAALDDSSVALLIAILGEISGLDFADELMEIINWGNETIFWHVQWALHRQALRHPDAMMRRFGNAAAETVPKRCAILEQILVMQPVEGDVQVLESLIKGYEGFAREDDAPTLLAGVAGALVARGKSGLAKTLARQHGSKLDEFEREELQKALRGSPFRMLAEEEIPDLNLEDVCVNGVLMEDESEELDQDELEDPLDLAPPPRPGRNDPCWCGSGKKYKKCHLNADEESGRKREAAPKAGAKESLYTVVMNRVSEAAHEWHKPSDLRRAREVYFGEHAELEPDEAAIGGFIEWLMLDFRDKATGRTAIENFLRTRGPKLTPAERELLESLREARYGLYEVERVVPGSGLDLHDLFTGDRMFVHDITSSHEAHRWDCILTRTQYYQGRWVFPGIGLSVPRHILDHVRGFIEDQSRRANQSPADYVRANSHSLHRVVREAFADDLRGIRVVNNEGEEVSFGSAEYSVSDAAALIAKLQSLEELEAEDPDESGKRRFVWLQPLGKERRLLGSLEIENGTLKAEAMSRTRLETLRGLVEFHGAGLVTHRGDHHTSVDEIKDRVIRGEKGPEPQPRSAEEIAAIQEYLAQHYSRWPDENLPALGGRKARQAVQDPAGRQAVIDLLRMMENGEGRKQADIPAYDFNILRRELGLPEE